MHHAGYASDPEKETAQTEISPPADREAAPFPDTKRIVPEAPATISRRPASAIYATFADAARETGYAEEYLKKLARKGQLRTAKNEKGFLLVSSLNAYLEKRGRTRIQAEQRPALQLVKDEQRMKAEQDVDTPASIRWAGEHAVGRPSSLAEQSTQQERPSMSSPKTTNLELGKKQCT